MEHRRKIETRTIVLVGVLAALVFALSWLQIPFALPFGETSRVHFGNIMCLLSGLLFGPWVGGLAAGFGSMLFDFSNPAYAAEFWITFLTKFAMGFVAGWLARHLPAKMPGLVRYALAGTAGSLTYVALYMFKSVVMQRFVYGNEWAAVWAVVPLKGLLSAINGLIAVAASVALAPALRYALDRAGLFRPRHSAG